MARAERRLDEERLLQGGRAGRSQALQAAERVTDQPRVIVLRTISAWPAPAQNAGEAHGSALGRRRGGRDEEGAGLRPRPDLRGRRGRHGAHPQGGRAPARRRRRPATTSSTAWAASRRPTSPCSTGCDPHPARRLGHGLPELEGQPRDGRGHPQGVRRRHQRGRRPDARALGRLGRPRGLQQHHHRGRTLVHPEEPVHQNWKGDPYAGRVLHFGIREHGMGAILNGITVHGAPASSGRPS